MRLSKPRFLLFFLALMVSQVAFTETADLSTEHSADTSNELSQWRRTDLVFKMHVYRERIENLK